MTGIAPADHEFRLHRARSLMRDAGLDALLVGAGPSLRYFTGLDWPPTERLVALLLPRDGAPVLVCPAFEHGSLQRAACLPLAVRLWDEDQDPTALIAAAIPGGVLGLDPDLPFRVAQSLRRHGCTLADGDTAIDGCRRIKSDAELAVIARAMHLTLEVQRRTAAMLHPGILASTVRRFVDDTHRALGAAAGSSFCAVQFGQATAYPHGIPGDQTLAERDLVLIDTGCILHGYHSDITRTYAFGPADPAHTDIWTIERAAQQAAFDAIRPGVPCADIDRAARSVLERHGLGPGFRLPGLPHRTGHGIGLSIHEPPYLVPNDRTVLEPGMCVSIEPMIVIPDRFGIRLEDHAVVTDTGARWFTEPAASIGRPFG